MSESAPHKKDCAVLVVGEYYCDLVFSGLEGAPRLGTEHYADDLAILTGGTYTMALALTRLGVDTVWACAFGTDLFSTHVRQMAQSDGIDPRGFSALDMPVQRVSVVYAARGERGFISYSEPQVAPPEPEIAALRPRWLLQTFRFEPAFLAFVRAQKRAGALVLLDCRGGDFTLSTKGVEDLIASSDVFSPNAEEALRLTGAGDLLEAGERLARIAQAVVIKAGPDGAWLFAGGRRAHVAAPQVAVRDTVGAGDSFNAGLLAGLTTGATLVEAIEWAVACGTLSTLGTGGRACPTRPELDAMLISMRKQVPEGTP